MLVLRTSMRRLERFSWDSLPEESLDSFLGRQHAPQNSTFIEEVLVLRPYEETLVCSNTDNGKTTVIPRGSRVTLSLLDTAYCKWNTAPLDKSVSPTERTYCCNRASSPHGFCVLHKNSERRVYEACFSLNSVQALRYCKELDRLYGDALEYSLYLQVTHDFKVKVGVTRAFRLYERIAEQPHIIAIEVGRFTSATSVRKAELTASKKLGFTQHSRPGLKRSRTISKPVIIEALSLLLKSLEALRRTIRIEKDQTETRPFLVLHRTPSNTGKPVHIRKTGPLQIVFEGLYYNMLIARTKDKATSLIPLGRLLHKTAVLR